MTGSLDDAFYLSGGLLTAAVVLSAFLRPPTPAKGRCRNHQRGPFKEERMAALNWKHNRPRDEARARVQEALAGAGYGDALTWEGYTGTARLGWGLVLDARVEVTDDAIVLQRCEGAMGGQVLRECRSILERIFPEGAGQAG